MATDLPYNDAYAVIDAGHSAGYIVLGVSIRNPENHTFRSDYDLVARYYFDKDRDCGYGGEVKAEAYAFTERMCTDAAKTLRKVNMKLTRKRSKKNPGKDTALDIVQILQSVGVKEVRINPLGQRFHGWNHIEPIDTTKPKNYDKVYAELNNLCYFCLEGVKK